jgi:16S rRNA processing protein RimM
MVIGEVTGSFGVRGEMKVHLLTDFPERFSGLREVFLGPERKVVSIERVRRHQGRLVMKLDGFDTPEAVDGVRGFEIAVPRAEAVALPAGQYYLDQIVDSAVFGEDGREIGRIADVLRTGANDVFVVRAHGEEVLIPAISDAIAEMDVAGKRVVVREWVLEPGV